MRTSSLLTLALVPAALIAQAPAALTFSQRLATEGPVVEQLLKSFQPEQALAKAEAMLPASQPVFIKTDGTAARGCSFQFSDLARTYHLAGKAAISAGAWEKGRDYFIKAKDTAQENFDQTSAALTPAMAAWDGPMAAAKAALETGAARFAQLSAKQPLTPEETAELGNFTTHKNNITNGTMIHKVFNQDISTTKTERDAFGPMIDGSNKAIAAEKAEMDKVIASKKFKGSREKYLAAVLNAENLASRSTQQEKLNFLYRLQFHCGDSPQAAKVKAVIEHIRLNENPFPVAKPSKKKKA